MRCIDGFTETNVPGLVSAEEYENLLFSLILMHHYQLSDFINKYSRVRSSIDHPDRAHVAKPHFVNLIGKIANQVVSRITHCHIQSINFVNQLTQFINDLL